MHDLCNWSDPGIFLNCFPLYHFLFQHFLFLKFFNMSAPMTSTSTSLCKIFLFCLLYGCRVETFGSFTIWLFIFPVLSIKALSCQAFSCSYNCQFSTFFKAQKKSWIDPWCPNEEECDINNFPPLVTPLTFFPILFFSFFRFFSFSSFFVLTLKRMY